MLRILVVDDEPLGRDRLVDLLEDEPGAEVIATAADGVEAVEAIRTSRPDLVFLDVQMPRIDGFGVIEAIGARDMPPVIFVTAYDAHAVKAFEVHAVDYLVKPVDPDRFRDAVDRARRVIANGELDALRTTLASVVHAVRQVRLVTEAGGGEPTPARLPGDPRIPLRAEGRVVFVDPREIDWVESLANYVRLHARGRSLRHRATMDDMERILGPGFVRIRRSILVRSSAILYCEPLGKGSWVVVLHDQTRLTSSRYYRAQLAPLFGE